MAKNTKLKFQVVIFTTHAGSAFDNHVTFNLLTSVSCAKRLPCTVCLPSLVLIARANFLLQHTVTYATDHPTHGSDTAGVDNDICVVCVKLSLPVIGAVVII